MNDKLDEFPKKESGKLNIYFHLGENSGVGYYRQYLPALTLREKGIANTMISDFRWGEGQHQEPDMKLMFDIARWADIIVVGRRDRADFYPQWGAIREFFNVPIVLDTDDNIHHVRPHNPGYMGYVPGSESMVWNKYALNKIFDAVTVSTQDLYDFHKKDNPKIYVLPNNLPMQEWDKHPKKESNDDFVKIMFACSAAHTDGVRMIKEPIIKILQKYPKTKFLITHIFRYLFNDAPKEIQSRIEPVGWVKLEDWPKGLKGMEFDIGIAPLTDNMFNRAKSNLRWLEYSACGVPTIASAVKPYLCIENNKNGILVKESSQWYNALDKLVSDKTFRTDLGHNAYQTISEKYSIEKNIALWNNVYKDIHDKYHDFFGVKFKFIKQGNKYKKLK